MATYVNYVPVKLPDDQLRELDRLARERETTRSEVLRLGLRVLAESQQQRGRQSQQQVEAK